MDLLLSSRAKTVPSNYTVRGFTLEVEPEGITQKDWDKNYWAIMTRVHLDKPKQKVQAHPLYELWNNILEETKVCDTQSYGGVMPMNSLRMESGELQS